MQPAELVDRVDALVDERRKLEREVTELKKKLALGGGGQSSDETRQVGDLKFLGKVVSGVAPRDLKGMADEAKASLGSGCGRAGRGFR